MINILIIDGQVLVRRGVRGLLAGQADFNVVAEAGNYDEAVEQLSRHRVDAVVLDTAMPGGDGHSDSLGLIAHVCAVQPQARIIVLTMQEESAHALRALKSGARGYVTKDVTPELLITAIRRVVGGGSFMSPNIAETLALRLVHQDDRQAAPPLLSKRELTVYGLLADGRTVRDIAQKLALSTKTVSAHKIRVMKKLKLSSVGELVRYAIEHGGGRS